MLSMRFYASALTILSSHRDLQKPTFQAFFFECHLNRTALLFFLLGSDWYLFVSANEDVTRFQRGLVISYLVRRVFLQSRTLTSTPFILVHPSFKNALGVSKLKT